MISARFHPGFEALVRLLEAKAGALAQASAQTSAMGQDNPRRWRSARLIWPLFTKG